MAEELSVEGVSTSGASVSSSDSTVELNVKTLDSQIYNFHVDKSMPVSSFKGKIADQIGMPVAQQRLIFRGKVLKDEHLLSEYHVENGDTLHLVERQPSQQATSGAGSADTSSNAIQGNDGGVGAPRNRIGQISHSVVLGTFNVGDQGEGAVTDLTRVIGAVLNSLGVGNQSATNVAVGAQNAPSNATGPHGNGTEQGQGVAYGQSQAGNLAQSGQPVFNQPFQMPFTAAAIPLPSLNMPIPDSLNTISVFINRLEDALSRNGYQPAQTPPDVADQPAREMPYNARGVPTSEALSIVLRHAQRLLSGQAVAALSHIAGRLEQEGASTDNTVRSQIQTDSVRVAIAMQHLGALFLELGRTIMMLRMGQSPAESVVNAGPAVYFSPSGLNPIMVQPFPHQTIPLFNAAATSQPNAGSIGPIGIVGSAPRNVNIHIHAGTSIAPMVSAVGARAGGVEGAQGERSIGIASGDSGATRVFPVGNIIAAVPTRTATVAVSQVPNASQPAGGVSTSQPSDIASLSSTIRNLFGNIRVGNQTQGQQNFPNSLTPSDRGHADVIDPSKSMQSEGSGEASESSIESVRETLAQHDQAEGKDSVVHDVLKSSQDSSCIPEASSSCPIREPAKDFGCNLDGAEGSGVHSNKSNGSREVPLGLGGGLQPKRRTRPSKEQHKNGEGGPCSIPEQSQAARTTGLEVLQSLASRSTAGGTSTNDVVTGQTGQGLGQPAVDLQPSAQSSSGQLDVTGMMSQLLDSPALNGLLSGVAQQTGVGSPDALRNMLQQFTQNPAMRNTVNQLAQQVDTEDFRHMFAGGGAGQDGGLDFSRMFQQMMPVVSQVLGGGAVRGEESGNILLQQFDDREVNGGDPSFGQRSQTGIQDIVQRIAGGSSSPDVFGALVQNAAERAGMAEGQLVDGLRGNEDLAREFLEILRGDMRRQLEDGSEAGGKL